MEQIFNPQVVRIARDINLRLTISVDGPREIHDRNRKYPHGGGSFDIIYDNVKRYREAELRVLAFETVYSSLHMKRGVSMLQLCRFLADEFKADHIILSPVLGGFSEREYLQEEEFADYVEDAARELMQFCVSHRFELPYSELLRSQLDLLLGSRPNSGWCTLGYTTLTVGATGEVYPCYTLMSSRETWEMADSMTEFNPKSHRVQSIYGFIDKANPRSLSECASCEIRDICAGCPGAGVSRAHRLTARDQVACSYRLGGIEGVLQGWLTQGMPDNSTAERKDRLAAVRQVER